MSIRGILKGNLKGRKAMEERVAYIRERIAQVLIVSLIVYTVGLPLNNIVAFAETNSLENSLKATSSDALEIEDDIELVADDIETGEYKYCIDVAWGRMSFVYDKGTWDVDELKYVVDSIDPSRDTLDGEPGWYGFDGDNNKISIINVSKQNDCVYDLYVDDKVRFDTEDSEYIEDSEVSGLSFSLYDNKEFKGEGVESIMGDSIEKADSFEKSKEYYLTVDGTPVGLSEERVEIGSVVVKVHKPEIKSKASVGMMIEASDEVEVNNFDTISFNVEDILATNSNARRIVRQYGPSADKETLDYIDNNFGDLKDKGDDYFVASETEDEVAVKISIPKNLREYIVDYTESVGEFDEDSLLWTLGKGQTIGTLDITLEYPEIDKYSFKARVGHLTNSGKFKLGLTEEDKDDLDDNIYEKEIAVVEKKVASPSNATPSDATPSDATSSDADKATDSNASTSNAGKDFEESENDLEDFEEDKEVCLATPSEIYKDEEDIEESLGEVAGSSEETEDKDKEFIELEDIEIDVDKKAEIFSTEDEDEY